jgi:hypothetical protein
MTKTPPHKRRRGKKTLSNGRSVGEAKHIRIYRYMFNSLAYRDMTTLQRCALQELMFRYNGQNNGEIPFSVREMAERLGVSPKTAHKALKGVIQHGFAKEAQKGSFTLKARHATEWLLTMFGYPKADDQPSKDFMRWNSSDTKIKTQREILPSSVVDIPIEGHAEQ